MLLFPLPFLTAFFLIFILLQLAGHVGKSLPPLTMLTVGAYALQSVLLGVQWGIAEFPPMIVASVAFCLPPLTWLTLNELSGRSGPKTRRYVLLATLTAVLLLNAAFFAGLTDVVDLAGVAIYALIGTHLIWLGLNQEMDWMASRPLHALLPIQRAFLVAGAILLVSASVDVMVAVDIRLNDSQISSALVGYSNLTLLLILMLMFFRMGNAPAAHSRQVAQPSRDIVTDEDGPSAAELLEKLDAEMEENHLYRSENLSLNQISRRIRIPARQVSGAVNSMRAMNVPQYVNTFRIKDACRMLEETETPVTEIVFEVGFTTKSNFNREFQRVTGLSPSAWRTRSRKAPSAKETRAQPAMIDTEQRV